MGGELFTTRTTWKELLCSEIQLLCSVSNFQLIFKMSFFYNGLNKSCQWSLIRCINHLMYHVEEAPSHNFSSHFSSVQLFSHVQLFVTSWTAAHQASLSITNSQSLLRLMLDGDTTQPSHPLSSPSPPAFNLFQHQGISNESVLRIRWPKYRNFSFSISPFNEYSGLIAFRID